MSFMDRLKAGMEEMMTPPLHPKTGPSRHEKPPLVEEWREGDHKVIKVQRDNTLGCGFLFFAWLWAGFGLLGALQAGQMSAAGTMVLVMVGALVVQRVLAQRYYEFRIYDDCLDVRTSGVLGSKIGTWYFKDVEQIYVRQRTKTQKVRDQWRSSGYRKVKRHYNDLWLIDSKGRKKRLASNVHGAVYIEQEIEDRLGIVDRPMGVGPQR